MSDTKAKHDGAASAARHGRDMQRVSDGLRDLITTLQSSRERLAEVRTPTPAPGLTVSASPPPPTPPAPADALESGAAALDRKRLEAELARAREQLGRASAERALLRERLSELEEEHRRVCDGFVEAEDRASQLVQLHATLQQLHGAVDREALLQVVQEVVINVIGSEELAIFELRGGELRLARAFGVDPGPLQRIALGQGPLGRAAQGGTLLVAGRDPDLGDDRLTACVPLTAGGRMVGLVAVYRLLGHKPMLGPNDLEVFEMLGPHAGQALRLRRALEPVA